MLNVRFLALSYPHKYICIRVGPSNLGNRKNLWFCPCNSPPAIYGHWWNFLLCLYNVFSPGMHLRFHVVDSVICG